MKGFIATIILLNFVSVGYAQQKSKKFEMSKETREGLKTVPSDLLSPLANACRMYYTDLYDQLEQEEEKFELYLSEKEQSWWIYERQYKKFWEEAIANRQVLNDLVNMKEFQDFEEARTILGVPKTSEKPNIFRLQELSSTEEQLMKVIKEKVKISFPIRELQLAEPGILKITFDFEKNRSQIFPDLESIFLTTDIHNKIQIPSYYHMEEEWRTRRHPKHEEMRERIDELKEQISHCERDPRFYHHLEDARRFIPYLPKLEAIPNPSSVEEE